MTSSNVPDAKTLREQAKKIAEQRRVDAKNRKRKCGVLLRFHFVLQVFRKTHRTNETKRDGYRYVHT